MQRRRKKKGEEKTTAAEFPHWIQRQQQHWKSSQWPNSPWFILEPSKRKKKRKINFSQIKLHLGRGREDKAEQEEMKWNEIVMHNWWNWKAVQGSSSSSATTKKGQKATFHCSDNQLYIIRKAVFAVAKQTHTHPPKSESQTERTDLPVHFHTDWTHGLSVSHSLCSVCVYSLQLRPSPNPIRVMKAAAAKMLSLFIYCEVSCTLSNENEGKKEEDAQRRIVNLPVILPLLLLGYKSGVCKHTVTQSGIIS